MGRPILYALANSAVGPKLRATFVFSTNVSSKQGASTEFCSKMERSDQSIISLLLASPIHLPAESAFYSEKQTFKASADYF